MWRRPRGGLAAVLAASIAIPAAIVLGVSVLASADAATPGPHARSTWARLDLPGDVYGDDGVNGAYGHVERDGDTGGAWPEADFSEDPDGIARDLPAAGRQAQVHVNSTAPSAHARATLTGAELRVPRPVRGGAAEVLTTAGEPTPDGLLRVARVSTLQNYVQCNPPHAPIVQANTAGDVVSVLGHTAPLGEETVFEVPGDYSGDIDTVRVTVNARTVVEVDGQRARARVVVTATAEGLAADGDVTDRAELFDLTLGDVEVDCDEAPSPSPSATTSQAESPLPPTGSPTTSPSPSPTGGPSPSPTTSPSPPPTGNPSPSASPDSPGPDTAGAGDGGGVGPLPVTGADLTTLPLAGLVLLGVGALLGFLSRQSRRDRGGQRRMIRWRRQ